MMYLRVFSSLFSSFISAKGSSKQTTLVVANERAHTSQSALVKSLCEKAQVSLIKEPRGR